ncbi:MAG: hypothetical protein KA472_11405 [Pseudomonadales bacterium]|nr:hypothetical protein [Pseudomonadales bacterium]
MFYTSKSSFARPANTTQYAANELVANSATAASVEPLRFSVEKSAGRGRICRARIYSSNSAVTAANFNLHLYSRNPGTPTNGDNGAFAVASGRYWLGTVACDLSSGAEITTSTDKSKGFAISGFIQFDLESEGDWATSRAIYGLLETAAAATYTPISGEVFEVALEIEA